MSRHRDIRNFDVDDFEDYNDYDGAGSYGSYHDVAHSPLSSQYVRSAANTNQMPEATDHSVAFFKVKPAKGGKKKGKGGGGGSGGGATGKQSLSSLNEATIQSVAEESPAARRAGGAAQASSSSSSQLMFDDDEFERETAAAIAASLDAPTNPSSSTSSTTSSCLSIELSGPCTTATATPSRAPIRSAEETAATMAAIESMRINKSNSPLPSPTSLHTPSSNLSHSRSSSSISSHHVTPVKLALDRPNLPLPTANLPRSASAQLNLSAEASPSPQSSVPSTPTASSSSSSSSTFDSAQAAQISHKRSKEIASIMAQEAEREKAEGLEKKEKLNLVVIGHVDAGKSTLMGHLLYLQGRVSKKLMHKYEKESKELGKQSFHFAWVLDQNEDERSRGVTIDVAVNYFETAHKHITLLDAPGHRDFIPNMISGAAQADAAVLVVPATRGEFEAGFADEGQIKEHAMLVRSLGVAQIIIAINKLDTIGWEQERYNEIVSQVSLYLKNIGFKEKDIWSVPVSGLTGENILSRSPDLPLNTWYNGPALIDLIDQFTPPTRYPDKPMRLCITDVFKSMSLGQYVIAGKVESGCILPKDRVLLQPVNEVLIVKSMESRGEMINIAKAGDNIEIGLKEISDVNILQVGQWISDPQHPIPLVTTFRCQILTLNYKIPLLAGTSVVLFTQSVSEPVVVTKLCALLDKSTSAPTKQAPRALPRNSSAEVEIESKRPICLELFREYRELGRFTIRRGHETVAVGIVTKLIK